MLEARDHLRLAFEALGEPLVVEELAGQDLERDVPVQPGS
jgi:hypothetical protein